MNRIPTLTAFLHSRAIARPDRAGKGLLLVLLLILAGSQVQAGFPGRADAASIPIVDGKLVWGFKQSWRNYVGTGVVSDGASVNPNGTYNFPVVAGSYDDETNTTHLQLSGSVHWQSYPDYPVPGHYGLDTTFKDLSIEIGPSSQVIRGTHVGYLRSDPGGELHTDANVVLAKLAVDAEQFSVADGSVSWTAIPSIAGPGFSLYSEGTPLDPVSVEYTGPGGAPDLGEHLDTPGQIVLKREGRWVSDNPRGTQLQHAREIFASRDSSVVHIAEITRATTAQAKLTISAHDAVTLARLQPPLEITYPKNQGHYFKFGFDPDTESIYYVTGRDGATDETTVRRARWNADSQNYELSVVGRVTSSAANIVGSVVWNDVKDELALVVKTPSSSSPYHAADLWTFRQSGEDWVADQDPLVVPAEGQLSNVSQRLPDGLFALTTGIKLTGPSLAVARDGSYVQAPNGALATVSGGSQVPMPALRIVPSWDDATSVEILWDTQLAVEEGSTYFSWAAASRGADGSVILHGVNSRPAAFSRIDVDTAGNSTVEEAVSWPYSGFGRSMTSDPVRGWDWATTNNDPQGHVLQALAGDDVLGSYADPEFISPTAGFPAIDVGPDGGVYLPVLDAEADRFGYQRLGIQGILATFATQPQDEDVSLGVGEEGKEVSFASTVVGGEPAPARQWQVKAPGSSSFADIGGQTGPTLTIEAKAAMGGGEYRAVYSSVAGKIASDAAKLGVDYAPRMVTDVPNRSVVEGADATFLVAADGNPEPAVTWQRRVGGYWQPIASDDDNFIVNGPSLTVLDTNTDQSGSLFRAKLTNSVTAETGTSVYSRAAKLTVTPRTSIPPEGLDLDNVSLDWTGNEEMQKVPPAGGSNYFSAGASNGDEASYRAVHGNAAVYQVSPSGGESLATWATRAAHLAAGGGEQLIRLFGGHARVAPDGSATVEWHGSFSVNFYGGLVPFTFTNPELVVDGDGTGTLTADMSGCGSSMVNPGLCTPLATVPDVTVATFSGVEIDPSGEVEVMPDYAGVEVVGDPARPQVKTEPGWGSWPQSFVAFHVQTGLAAYWYTSGSDFDPDKAPASFTVDFQGATAPISPPDETPDGDGPGSQPQPPTRGSSRPHPVSITSVRHAQKLGTRAAKLATLACPRGGTCKVTAPKRVLVNVAGKRYKLIVLAPKRVAAGGRAALRLQLPKRARTALGKRRVTLRFRVRSGGQTYQIRTRLRGAGKGRVRIVSTVVSSPS